MSFMQPHTLHATWLEYAHADGSFDLVTEADSSDLDSDRLSSRATGWCARLSAPGYMDCTEWCGPYRTEAEAIKALVDMFDLCPECFDNHDEDVPCEQAAS